jgi:DNA-binding transcriptional LysR family regulator
MLNLKFEQVRAFLHVARSRNNRRAANALYLTQPAINARIKNLEALLGAPLFERCNGTRRLSRKGEMLLLYAEKLELLVGQIERDIVAPDGSTGLLRIGVAETVAQGWAPQFILALRNAQPTLDIELEVDISSTLIKRLGNREIDVALAHGSSPDPRFRKSLLSSVELDWYTCSSDPVHDPEAACRMFGKPVITFPRDTEPYRETKSEVWKNIGEHTPIFPSSSLAATMQLVATGVGVAALPSFMASAPVQSGHLKRFNPQWRASPLCFAMHTLVDPADPMIAHAIEIARRVKFREPCSILAP